MFITDDGMIIDAKFIARENAPAPMLVTVFGMFIDVMLVALKALEPMLISCEIYRILERARSYAGN